MKKILLLIIFLLLLVVVGYLVFTRYDYSNNHSKEVKKIIPTTTSKISNGNQTVQITQRSIFIPYWDIGADPEYDRYIYFGVTANDWGIDRQEAGYTKLPKFIQTSEGKNTYLTLRLLNNDFNNRLLKDKNIQQLIIDETLKLEKDNNFKGLVIDLEINSLFSDQMTNEINDFVKDFYTLQKQNYKTLSLLIYGDVFYRKRLYDVSYLANHSDEIMVMAYDFSKSRGEPGPNFPLDAGLQYAYSFKTMINDYKRVVPSDKLTITYGMFGYDWTVDEKKRPINQAKALTLNEIKKQFIEKCDWKDCVNKRDDVSAETEIDYIYSVVKDNYGYMDYHIVWFEDEQSVKLKTDYLQKQGIGSVGYWARGYF